MGTSASSWNFKEKHVVGEHVYGAYASADASLICSGPPFVSGNNEALSTMIYPIGYLENFTLQQSKQLQRLYEIGSQRAYFIPGRVMGSVSIGRVYYHGGSLLKVLYAAYPIEGSSDPSKKEGDTAPSKGTEGSDETQQYVGSTIDAGSIPVVRVQPGANRFWLNLASDLFNQPMGLGMFFQDASEVYIGATYLESCYVQGHQLSLNAGSILLMEGATVQYDRTVPIALPSNDMVTLASAGDGIKVS
jgi:hypothetical protein